MTTQVYPATFAASGMGLWVLSSKHWTAPASVPVNLELVTTNTHTTHLEVVSELAGGPTKLGGTVAARP